MTISDLLNASIGLTYQEPDLQGTAPLPHIILDDRSLINFEGPDATHLLHNVLTCNVETLDVGTAQIGALLTPQGKVLFDFFVSKQNDDAFLIEIDAGVADAFRQRMMMYRLRSKVEISESSKSLVRISWGDDSSAGLRDSRFKGIDVRRSYVPDGAPTARTAFDSLRIAHGVPESGLDYALGDAFPHDISLDQNGGVDFKKGCYIGQEVVSRMHHRHTARRRILIAASDQEFGTADDLVADGKPVGTLGTKVGHQALALCRIDRVKEAMDAGTAIQVNGVGVALQIPPDVTYNWPHEADNG